MRRRSIVVLSAVGVLALLLCQPTQVAAQMCSAGARDLGRGELIPPTSLIIRELVLNLNMMATAAAQGYLVTPEIWLYDDGKKPNAFACGPTPRNRAGRVVIGVGMYVGEYRQLILRQRDRPGIHSSGITVVFLHEFAHVAQAQHGLARPDWDDVARELQADYLAGWGVGLSNVFGSVDRAGTEEAAQQLFEMGDYEFNDPEHHGAPCQRLEVFRRGVDAGRRGLNIAMAARGSLDVVDQVMEWDEEQKSACENIRR